MDRLKTLYRTSILFFPVRLMVLAYSYVLTGTKVEEPYSLREI